MTGSVPLWLGYFLAGLAAIAVYFTLSDHTQTVSYDLFGVSAMIAVLVGIYRNRPDVRLPWFGLSAGLGFLVIGDILLNDILLHLIDPESFPNLADVFYLAGNMTIAVSLALLVRQRVAPGDFDSAFDALIVATAAAVLSWLFLMVPYFQDETSTLLQKLVSIAYPAIDLAMLVIFARMLFVGGVKTPSFWFISGALVSGITADSVFLWLVLNVGVPMRGHPIDVGYLLWFILWGTAALHPSMQSLTKTGPAKPLQITRRRLVLLAAAALLVPVAGIVLFFRNGIDDGIVIPIASGVLFVLVLARMSGLIRVVDGSRETLARAFDRERALRQSAAYLLVATGRDGIYKVAVNAIVSLIGRDTEVRVMVG
jgi:hypothetical protein